MNPLMLTCAIAIALTSSLAGCGDKAAQPTTAPMAEMAQTGGAKTATVAATIMAVDASAGMVTLAHGPIAAVGWPAMTMAFKASPATVAAAKVGRKVDATLKISGGGGEIVELKSH
jgi:Cu(I)/Ag(I) efflux system protein CusF